MKMSLRLLWAGALAFAIMFCGPSSMAQQPAGGASAPARAAAPVVAPQPAAPAPQSSTAPSAPTAAPSVQPAAPAPAQTQAEQTATELSSPGNDAGKGSAAQPDFSPWSMFMSADLVVKTVMLGLVFASLVTWTMFIAKSIQLSQAQRQLKNALARIADARSLNEAQIALGRTPNVLSTLLTAASQEIRVSADSAVEGGIKERAASRFSEIVRMEARAVRYGMAIIATIGATAPFVGLFGTVWGIMDSFIGISKAHTTNLAVVAPGIAEALLATAIGLAAAIPAVIIYNHFSRLTKGYLELVNRGSGAIGRLLSRDLDRFHGHFVSRAAE
jgi:biopolymer transport protein ExbB